MSLVGCRIDLCIVDLRLESRLQFWQCVHINMPGTNTAATALWLCWYQRLVETVHLFEALPRVATCLVQRPACKTWQSELSSPTSTHKKLLKLSIYLILKWKALNVGIWRNLGRVIAAFRACTKHSTRDSLYLFPTHLSTATGILSDSPGDDSLFSDGLPGNDTLLGDKSLPGSDTPQGDDSLPCNGTAHDSEAPPIPHHTVATFADYAAPEASVRAHCEAHGYEIAVIRAKSKAARNGLVVPKE